MNRKSLYWQIPLLVLLVVGTFFIARQRRNEVASPAQPATGEAWQDPAGYFHEDGMVFGTVYQITYKSGKSLRSEIEAELAKVDGEFSMFNEHSTVSAINRGEEPRRSAMFNEVYALAEAVSRETGGAFDITVAPLVNAWGFGFKHEQLPTPQQVDSLLKIRSQMDFSAIAKGYGCDAVARVLKRHGISNFMIEIGGEVVTSGQSPRYADWRIGITTPTDDSLNVSNELNGVLKASGVAIATSGNYRNFYYHGGRKYAHTIDPRTGYPVQHELLSATVIAPTCAVADAYATSFMVLGLDSARTVLDRHPELMGYFIYSDTAGSLAVWHSPRLAAMIEQ